MILYMYYIYMIKNQYGKIYVGVTQNIKQRLYHHNTKQGAQFTKSKSVFYLTFSEEYKTLAEARKREIQIKKWRRDKKELLIEKFRKGLSTKFK